MEDNKPYTVAEFAEIKKVPKQAIVSAIAAQRIIPIETNFDVETCTIHPAYLDAFKIELIGIYEYAARKGVTPKSVYDKIDKQKIEYFLEPDSTKKMIDWVQYQNIQFRAMGVKPRRKNHTIN